MRKPNDYQSRLLMRIARGFMLRTKIAGEPDRFSLDTGETISTTTAMILIRNGWVTAERRDSMFDTTPQRYDALKP
ncbi:MAG TPA: hypothetical protein VGR84_18675 [Candidatus Acidoferrales bacterium]|nr:hypothetical protein [Candidatus Acidoferrales bacterium]